MFDTLASETLKTCSKCGQEKALDQFQRRSRSRSTGARHSHCAKCMAEYKALWFRKNKPRIMKKQAARSAERSACMKLWRLRRKEHIRDYAKRTASHMNEKRREHYAATPRAREMNKRRYASRSEGQMLRYLVSGRVWRKENKNKLRQLNRAYKVSHRDYFAVAQAKRKATIASCEINDFTVEQWEAKKKLYDFRCAYCGVRPRILTQDHIVPISKRGPHTDSNVVPACGPCNSSKNAGPKRPLVVVPAEVACGQ